MIIQKSNAFCLLGVTGVCLSLWTWLSMAPENAVSWVCGGFALVGFMRQCTVSRSLYTGLVIILMWALAYTHHTNLLVYVGIVVAALGPVSCTLQTKSAWKKACLLLVCWLWVEYLCALSIVSPDTYLVLRKYVLPISICVCWMQYPQWSACIAAWTKKYAVGVTTNVLIGSILGQFLVTWTRNALDGSFDSGLQCKHRILFMGVSVLPVLWKLFDLKQWSSSTVLSLGLVTLMYGAHARLGIIALAVAFCTRYLLCIHPKIFFISASAGWGVATLSTIFWFKYCLNYPVMIMVGSLNSSFYERLIFWKHFAVRADEVFWCGHGILNFFRLVFKPLMYQAIEQKNCTTVPSHTHWLWLDLRLSVGCVGIAIVTLLLFWGAIKYRNHHFTQQQATKCATVVYSSILYVSFYGIFWHTFVLAWLFFSWLLTDFLYQNVLRGTENNGLNFCSTWNNAQGAFYARQKK